ncbi:hypothetical protein F4779DRAFT_621538 [Xylariaceae sp. FL0662B]|nr:hypothetical protein F4779DRAFT_621538 [Xylariaceae sp. FL0662B]
MRYLHGCLLGLMAIDVRASLNSDNHAPLDARSSGSGRFDNYIIAPLVIRGAIEQGGIERNFTGTIQEIDAQIRQINPEFTWENFQPSTGNQPNPPRKRNRVKVLCHVQNLPPAPRNGVEANKDWLNNLAISLPVSLNLAQHLDAILETEDCATSGNRDLIQGQSFDSANYNKGGEMGEPSSYYFRRILVRNSPWRTKLKVFTYTLPQDAMAFYRREWADLTFTV